MHCNKRRPASIIGPFQKVSHRRFTKQRLDVEDMQTKQTQKEPVVDTQIDVLDNHEGEKVQHEPKCANVENDGNRSFAGKSLDEITVLEIFAGTARLTRAIRDLGMSAMAVDKDSSRAQSVHVACFDLNDPDQLQALCVFIEKHQHQILWAHFAPSCGTASKARGRPLPKLAKMGIRVPQPLRSDERPLGLDGLTGLDKVKAETANITYESTCALIRLCHLLGIAVSVENPEKSLFCKIPQIVALMEELKGYMTVFDNCCHGGTRKKGTAWWATVDWFTCLSARCDGSHFHEKWNAEVIDGKVVFPTHLEAAYPILLCERLASIAKLKALEIGAVEIETLEQQTQHAPSSQHRILLDMLPRGRKFKPLVSEFLNLDVTKNGPFLYLMDHRTNVFSSLFLRVQKSYIDSFARVVFGSMMRMRQSHMKRVVFSTPTMRF